MPTGEVQAIHTAPTFEAPVVARREVHAVPGRGLEGDRYFVPTEAAGQNPDEEITLIEGEALEHLLREHGIDLTNGRNRRNITTRGVALNALVGREFRAGGVRLRGIELCHPCAHLEGLTQKGVIQGLVNKGGLRAQILTDGIIRVGDAIEALPEAQ